MSESYPKYKPRRSVSTAEIRATIERCAAGLFNSIEVQELTGAELYSFSKTEVAPFIVETLKCEAQEITREVNRRRAELYHGAPIFIDEGPQSVIWSKYRALLLGTKGEFDDGVYGVKRPVDMSAYYDGVKAAARGQRIARNEMRVYPVIKQDVMAKTRREHDLCQAIERTQLPHATTIHERVMPYRVKEG